MLWNIITKEKRFLFEYILKCNLFLFYYKAEFQQPLLQYLLSQDHQKSSQELKGQETGGREEKAEERAKGKEKEEGIRVK